MASLAQIQNFISSRNTVIQICVAPPSQFIVDHQRELLPTWEVSITYVILVLQQSLYPLDRFDSDLAIEKDYLREQFLRLAGELVFAWRNNGYQSDLFDPRSGYPFLSRPGKMNLDDIATVNTVLDFPSTNCGDCVILTHPQWGRAVYPSTVVTTAPQKIVEMSLNQSIARLGASFVAVQN